VAGAGLSFRRGGQRQLVALAGDEVDREIDFLAVGPFTAQLGERLAEGGSARFLLLGVPFHGTLRIYGFGGLRFLALLGGFCEPAVQLKDVLLD
jgi:hypothetical protein